jgi:RNA polymerase sigma-70 factor, ECF subfamily
VGSEECGATHAGNVEVDAALVRRAQAGDRDAFGALVERHTAMAERIARGILGQPDQAREVLQDALLSALLALPQLRDTSRFAPWLASIVRHAAHAALRERSRAPSSLETLLGGMALPEPAAPAGAGDPEASIAASERADEMARALGDLSARELEVTRLYYYEDLGVGTIAARLGISREAVKSRLFQARKRLRGRLGPDAKAL